MNDVLVFGGGTLLQDTTSLRSFLYYALLIKTAVFLGCRVELWGNGLGDVRGRIPLKILKSVLGDVDYIGLRDKRSVYFARDILKNSRVIFERDLAGSLAPSPEGRINWLLKRFNLRHEDRTERYAVIAVKGTADRESILCMEKYMTELLDAEMRFLYIPMFEAEDRKESLRLRGAFGGSVAEHISESDVLGIMKRASVVCAMRYHALVFASMAGVPYRAFGKDPKVREFDQARA